MPAPDLDAFIWVGVLLSSALQVGRWEGKASVPGDFCHRLFAVYTNSALNLPGRIRLADSSCGMWSF